MELSYTHETGIIRVRLLKMDSFEGKAFTKKEIVKDFGGLLGTVKTFKVIDVDGDHNIDLEIEKDLIPWGYNYENVLLRIGGCIAEKGWRILHVEDVQRKTMVEPYVAAQV